MNGCRRAVGGDDRMEGACARGRKPGPRPGATGRNRANGAQQGQQNRTQQNATGRNQTQRHNGTGHAENGKKTRRHGDGAERRHSADGILSRRRPVAPPGRRAQKKAGTPAGSCLYSVPSHLPPGDAAVFVVTADHILHVSQRLLAAGEAAALDDFVLIVLGLRLQLKVTGHHLPGVRVLAM